MKGLSLICPECNCVLKEDYNTLYCTQGHSFRINSGIYNLLPSSMTELTKKDAQYHEGMVEDWERQTQPNVLRNRYFHKEVVEFICKRSSAKSNILELAGGTGFDLALFLSLKPTFGNYIFSEISEGMLQHALRRLKNDRVGYFCIDAHNIPFGSDQFDFVYTISAFHHFRGMDQALRELIRVTKKGGFIIFGIEPNRRWFKLISKAKKPLRKILPGKDHSPADDEAEGFFVKDFEDIARDYRLKLLRVEPVWFSCGFLHYGLDLLYKLLRLKRRIHLPSSIEKIFIGLDRISASYEFLKIFSWHYSVIYQK